MEQEICKIKHEAIDKHFETTDRRLDNHGNRIDKLEIGQTKTDTIVQNLCKEIEALVTAIKWLVAGIAATGGGFIIWYIQTLP
jgi:hypothetical protein